MLRTCASQETAVEYPSVVLKTIPEIRNTHACPERSRRDAIRNTVTIGNRKSPSALRPSLFILRPSLSAVRYLLYASRDSIRKIRKP